MLNTILVIFLEHCLKDAAAVMHFQENLKVEKFFRNLTFLLLLLISKTYKWALIVQYRKVEIENRNIRYMPISKSEVSLVLCVVWFSSQQNGLQLKIMI